MKNKEEYRFCGFSRSGAPYGVYGPHMVWGEVEETETGWVLTEPHQGAASIRVQLCELDPEGEGEERFAPEDCRGECCPPTRTEAAWAVAKSMYNRLPRKGVTHFFKDRVR